MWAFDGLKYFKVFLYELSQIHTWKKQSMVVLECFLTEFGKLQFTDYICYNNDIRTTRIVKLTVKLDSQLFHKTFSITDLITWSHWILK